MLEKGFRTVGTEITIKHIAPTPIGMNVQCNTEIIDVSDRRITFKVECFDEISKIAEGTHNINTV